MRIGLIAMSGIRACDQELLALGLTLPGFVERSKAIASLPSLGLLTLAGMTPARHEMRYIELADLREMESLPADFDLVAISSFSAQIKEGYRLAQRYRALGIPVVMGGLHVTMNPLEPQRWGASAVLGEGEIVWPEILADTERGRLEPLYDARGREFDLAEAPMPAFELLDMSRYNRITVQTSRGCPWRCSFCASSILLTRRYKQKPVGKVLAEIDRIRALWPRPFIEFADDNSFVNPRYWRELLPELEKRRVRWFTETDLSVHEDEELLHMMRRAGCVEVLIGFESPGLSGLDGIELRRNWKYERHGQYLRAIERIQAAGIRVNACFVVGLDGHDPSVFEALLDFVREARPFDVQVTVPTPFPGTPFHAQLTAEGRLLEEGAWERCTLFDVNFRPQGMTVEELRAGLRRLVVALYSDRATRERREHFRKGCLRKVLRLAAWRVVLRGAA
ncbi:MAG TPA: radical SAM protein [Burkholderiales bacterium]|nr:radical SAM protein [Burkholderiales bacterium]